MCVCVSLCLILIYAHHRWTYPKLSRHVFTISYPTPNLPVSMVAGSVHRKTSWAVKHHLDEFGSVQILTSRPCF